MGEPGADQGGTGQVRTAQVGTGQVRTSPFRTVQVRKDKSSWSSQCRLKWSSFTWDSSVALLSPTCYIGLVITRNVIVYLWLTLKVMYPNKACYSYQKTGWN